MSIVKEVLEKLNVPIEKDNGAYYSINAPWREGSDSQAVLIDAKSGYFKDLVENIGGSFDDFISKVLGRPLSDREKK